MGEEYYAYINPHMHTALSELINDFDILKSYKPILAKMLDDKKNKGTFAMEIGEKEKEVELQLTNEELRFVNSDIRYLIDPDEKLFIKLYYHAIPQLNPKIAKKIIEKNNKKLSGKVVTKLSLLKNYCPAEDYHQKYLEKKI